MGDSNMSHDPRETGVWKLTREQKLELVNWMFSLSMDERIARAQPKLAEAYPTAPEHMLRIAGFHLYVDGPDAVLNWLADLARFLRSTDGLPPDEGHTYDLMHHVYNWWQFCELLPEGKPGLQKIVKENRDLIEEGSPEAALGSVKILEEMIEGNLDFPQIGV
jgi:hypothetical protein